MPKELTKEQSFPDFEEFQINEYSTGGQIELEGGESFFPCRAI